MPHKMHFPILGQLGLNNAESIVYELLVELGPKPAQSLLKPSGLGRGNLYSALTTLKKKGLVTEKKGVKTIFHAQPPTQLVQLFEQEQKRIQHTEATFKQLLPNLISTFQLSTGKPTIQLFEGKEGIIQMYEEVLKLTKKELFSIEDKGEMGEFIPEYFPLFIKKRVEKGIFNKVIAPSTNAINITSKKEKRETHTIHVNEFPFSMDIKLFEEGMSLVTFQKDTAIGLIIQHPVIAENFRILFDYLWKQSTLRLPSEPS